MHDQRKESDGFIEVKVGKFTMFNMKPDELNELVTEHKLQINLLESSSEIEKIGNICITMQSFKKDMEIERHDDKFKKAIFALLDNSLNPIGHVEIEMSLTRKPTPINKKKFSNNNIYSNANKQPYPDQNNNNRGDVHDIYGNDNTIKAPNNLKADNIYDSYNKKNQSGTIGYSYNPNHSEFQSKQLNSSKIQAAPRNDSIISNSGPYKNFGNSKDGRRESQISNDGRRKSQMNAGSKRNSGRPVANSMYIDEEIPEYCRKSDFNYEFSENDIADSTSNQHNKRPETNNRKDSKVNRNVSMSMGENESYYKYLRTMQGGGDLKPNDNDLNTNQQPRKSSQVNNYILNEPQQSSQKQSMVKQPEESLAYSGTNMHYQDNRRASTAGKSNIKDKVQPSPGIKPQTSQSGRKQSGMLGPEYQEHLNLSKKNSYNQDKANRPPAEDPKAKRGVKATLSIHEMANGFYCPPPMFYCKKKVDSEQINMSPSEIEDNFGMGVTKNFAMGEPQNLVGMPQQIQNHDNKENQAAGPGVQNIIQQNSDETKKLIKDKNFQQNINGGNLLDIFLSELLKQKKDNTSVDRTNFEKNFKIQVEHYNTDSMPSNAQMPNQFFNKQKQTPQSPRRTITKNPEMKIMQGGESAGKLKPQKSIDKFSNYDGLTISQSRGELNKYPLDPIKESRQESVGQESGTQSIRESIQSSGLKNSRSMKRGSTKYDEDWEDVSMTVSQQQTSVGYQVGNFKKNSSYLAPLTPVSPLHYNKKGTQHSIYSNIEEDFEDDFEGSETQSRARQSFISDFKGGSRQGSMIYGTKIQEKKKLNDMQNSQMQRAGSGSIKSDMNRASEMRESIIKFDCQMCGQQIDVNKINEHINECVRRTKNPPPAEPAKPKHRLSRDPKGSMMSSKDIGDYYGSGKYSISRGSEFGGIFF